MALAADRNTPERSGKEFSAPVAAATKCFSGGIACLDVAGNAVPGSAALNLIAVGRFEETVDNSAGQAGDLSVKIRAGEFRFDNSAGDAIDRTGIGKICYIEDDETVSATDGGGAQSAAGYVTDVDDYGVWVSLAPTA